MHPHAAQSPDPHRPALPERLQMTWLGYMDSRGHSTVDILMLVCRNVFRWNLRQRAEIDFAGLEVYWSTVRSFGHYVRSSGFAVRFVDLGAHRP
jgi:hypothetical protein